MAEDESWVFDSLIYFLNGPIWNAPLQSFIEERSLIFEPNVTENGDYRKIYNEFRNLVDFMLGTFMEDIGISPQQFEDACNKGAREGVPLHFDQSIFEQIWAANDYEMFKRMMTQRNVELQLQALELIEQKYGRTPQIFIPKKKDEIGNASGETTVEISPMPLHKSSDLEREILEEVSKQFTEEGPENEPEEQYLMEEKLNLEETLKKAIEEKLTTQKLILEQEKEQSELDDQEATEIPVDVAKPMLERIAIDRPQNTVDNAEIKKRQEYLRAQRDKLVAMKKEVRKKHLDDDQEVSGKSRMRPKSARAAEALLNGDSSGTSAESKLENQQIKLRKALVQRLKSEVIGKQ